MWDGINKRRFPRAKYPCKIRVKKKGNPDSLSTKTENIGVGGICVILPKDLGIFAPVEINIDLLDELPIVECEGTVVWIVERKQAQDRMYDTGIEFTNLKKEDADRINSIVERILAENNGGR